MKLGWIWGSGVAGMMSRCWVWLVVTTAAEVKGLGATCRKHPLMQFLFFVGVFFAKHNLREKKYKATTTTTAKQQM